MAPRGEITLTVTFGPAATPVLPRAVAYATEHADDLSQEGPSTWRAIFRLGSDPERYGRAMDLVGMVSGWRATHLEVEGSPGRAPLVSSMLWCAGEWLVKKGRCGAAFHSGPWAKCRSCPLYDPEWALESWVEPTWSLAMGEEGPIVVPDHLPEDWA